MTRPTIVAGNWKLNPPRAQGLTLFRSVVEGVASRRIAGAGFRTLVIPPYPYLGCLEPADGVELGAQDVAVEGWGAYTGAVGAGLLREFGVTAVLVGHSERRQIFGETDADTSRKVEAALAGGLEPVLCVGETEPERDAGETFEVVERQLLAGLESVGDEPFVLAYEPVWAIGTGRVATPSQAAEVHRFLRNRLEQRGGAERAARTPILYGGSVKAENAAALLDDKDIDGALVGGASLEAEAFLGIVDAGLATVAP